MRKTIGDKCRRIMSYIGAIGDECSFCPLRQPEGNPNQLMRNTT
jgi:hypothetical protein